MAVAPPRLASSLLLLAERASAPGGFAVLMLQRHSGARFMARRHAFPGGCVEPADFPRPAPDPSCPAPDLSCPVPDLSCPAPDLSCPVPSLARRHAALRELAEETGCALCGDGSVAAAGEEVPDTDMAAAAARLVPFAHWITPEGEPCRYDTAFFAAAVPPETPAEAQLRRQESEVSSLLWITPQEALQRHEHAGTPFSLPPVTYLLLHTLAQYRSAADVLDAWKNCREDPTVVLPKRKCDEKGVIQAIHIPQRYVTAGALDAGLYQYPNPSLKGEERYVEVIVGDISKTCNVRKLRGGAVIN